MPQVDNRSEQEQINQAVERALAEKLLKDHTPSAEEASTIIQTTLNKMVDGQNYEYRVHDVEIDANKMLKYQVSVNPIRLSVGTDASA